MTLNELITIYVLTCFLNLFLIIILNRYIYNNSNIKLEIGISLFAILTFLPGTIVIVFLFIEALLKKLFKNITFNNIKNYFVQKWNKLNRIEEWIFYNYTI